VVPTDPFRLTRQDKKRLLAESNDAHEKMMTSSNKKHRAFTKATLNKA
jgi:hypothetical protein